MGSALLFKKPSSEIRSFKRKTHRAEASDGRVFSSNECISLEVFKRLYAQDLLQGNCFVIVNRFAATISLASSIKHRRGLGIQDVERLSAS